MRASRPTSIRARLIISAPRAAASSSPGSPSASSTRRASRSPCPRARPTPAPCTRRSCRRGLPPEHEHGGHPELVDFTRRLKVEVPLSLALVALDMGQHAFGIDLLPFLSPQAHQWLKLGLAIPAVLWCGWPFFVRGFASIRSGWLNMFTLIALGTGAAFL